MTRRGQRRVTRAEAKLWRLVVRDAQPLNPGASGETDAPEPEAPPSTAEARPTAAPSAPPPAQAPASPAPLPTAPAARRRPAPPPVLEHGRLPGVDRRTAQRVRRGQREIEAVLDLHGMGREAAHQALTAFVTGSRQAGRRCVLVVTGKGRRGAGDGVLKAAVPRWLNDAGLRDHVLGFSHARPQHGGEGALYVLLRRRR